VAGITIIDFDNLDGKMNDLWEEQRPMLFTLSDPYELAENGRMRDDHVIPQRGSSEGSHG
jgi:hypothetical protein